MSLEKIQHIIKYIEENYNQDISIQRLEQLSNYSYRNVQRVFKNVFDESLGAFQKRLKLENAYKKLIYTLDPITDIAYSLGFDSLQSFSKSFKKQFNVSPVKARKDREIIFDSFIGGNPGDSENIAYEIVFLKETKVSYIGTQTKNYRSTEIELLWNKIDKILNVHIRAEYYGIIVDQPLITDKVKCRYEACVDQEIANKEFFSSHILGSRYAKYIHKGSYSSIEDTYRRIYRDWLFNSSLELDYSPIIEHYVKNDCNAENPDDYVTEILVPLKKR